MARIPFELKGKTVFVAGHGGMVGGALMLKLVSWPIAVYTLLALPVMFLGQRIGLRYFHRGSDRTHRTIAVCALAAIAVGAAVKGLSELL